VKPGVFCLPKFPLDVVFVILLMEEILHQLIGSLSHYLQGFIHPGGAGFLPSTVCNKYYIICCNHVHMSMNLLGNFICFFPLRQHKSRKGA